MASAAACPRCGATLDFVATYRRPVLAGYGASPANPYVSSGENRMAPGNARWNIICTNGHTWLRQAAFQREWAAAGLPTRS
jgi:hypothetical protein